MIAEVLADLRSRTTHADSVRARDETITATLSGQSHALVSVDQSDTVQIRVVADGRLGWAGGDSSSIRAVADRAVDSAAAGDPAELFLPAPAALPVVVTRSPPAAALTARDLVGISGQLANRLRRLNLPIETWAERSSGGVEVGNSRGVLASYDLTVVGVGVSVGAGPAPCRLHLAGVAPPDETDLDRLVDEVERRFTPPVLELTAPPAGPIWFAPGAVRGLVAPLLSRQLGDGGLGTQGGRWTIDSRLSLYDDPLVDGRPGSRPICDDGVPTQRLALIQAGRPSRSLLDLRTASRHRLPATGHGVRRGYRGPRAAFSNLSLESDEPGTLELAAAVGDGLLVSEFEIGPAPSQDRGVFRVAVPWCYRIVGGRVVGRVAGVVLAGDAIRLLERVAAIGADAAWYGAIRLRSLVLEGVLVSLR